MASEGLSRKLNKLCRLCGGCNAVVHIFDTNGSLTLSAQAMSCAKIHIELGDGLPDMVCEKCSHQVNISYLFKLQCEDSDRSFRSLLSDTSKIDTKSIEPSSKLSITLKLENESDNEDDKKQLNKIRIDDCMQSYTSLIDPEDNYSSNDEIFINCIKRSNSTESNCIVEKNVKIESLDMNPLRECSDSGTFKYNPLELKLSLNKCDKSESNKTNIICGKNSKKCSNDFLKTNKEIFSKKICAVMNHCNHEAAPNDEFENKTSVLCHLCGQKYIPSNDQYKFLSIANHKSSNSSLNPQLLKLNSAKWPGLKKKTQDITNRRYMCDVCGLTYRERSVLLQHKNTHNTTKMHNCNVCGKRFTRSSHVIAHMRIHNNIKPYVCETCGKTFTKSSDLCRHKRVHSDVRNYACSICNRRFKRSGDITSHMRTHTGDRPYSCPRCNKSYSSHSSLRKHKKMHCNSKSRFTLNNENMEMKIALST